VQVHATEGSGTVRRLVSLGAVVERNSGRRTTTKRGADAQHSVAKDTKTKGFLP
jgi:hypothetical protein